ncbi:hypothetical protein FACS1894152_5190 [Bacilli bacterium]|nr:hypothetical protein FACS1894152_5190 [Bacilli bacterium]
MAKLDPKQIKVFAKNSGATGTTVFGSTKNGSTQFSKDPNQLQSTYYQDGWKQAEVLNKAPLLGDFNTIQYLTSRELFYLAQTGGFREWIDDTGSGEDPLYNIGSVVNVYDGSGQPVLYVSLVDANQGNSPATDDGSHWQKFLYSKADMDVIIRALEGKSSRLNGYSFSFITFSDPSSDPTDYQAQQTEVTNYALAQLNLTDPNDIPNFIGVHNLNGDHLFLFDQGTVSPLDNVWIDNGLDTLVPASKTVGGYVQIGDNINVNEDGLISSPVATSGSLGVVQVGSNISVSGNGTISIPVASYVKPGVVQIDSETLNVDAGGLVSVPTGTKTARGLVQPGDNVDVTPDGIISVPSAGSASPTNMGLVRIGNNINIDDGTISVNDGAFTRKGVVRVGVANGLRADDQGNVWLDPATTGQMGTVRISSDSANSIKLSNTGAITVLNGMPVGTIFHSLRRDTPPNCLPCDGSLHAFDWYPTQELQNLWANGSLYSSDMSLWQQNFDAQGGNVGWFGVNWNDRNFKTPCIQERVFLSKANSGNAGVYQWDQIVNIYGNVNWVGGSQGHTELSNADGCFEPANLVNNAYPDDFPNNSNNYRGFNFNAARQVRTGDQVQPRHIMTQLYIIISRGS